MNEESLQWLKEISTTTGVSYSGDKTITTDFANEVIDYIHKLQNNWNELKKWLEGYLKLLDNPDYYEETMFELIKKIIDEMQELEQGKDESN